jgi:hypothetical protein
MFSLKQLIDRTKNGEDFYLLLGDFLDEFYRSSQSDQQVMINDGPLLSESSVAREWLGFAASTAHKLANDYGLVVPTWVFDKRCYLYDRPYFGGKATGTLRLLFMYTSPTEFKHRNLFVDENVLVRI